MIEVRLAPAAWEGVEAEVEALVGEWHVAEGATVKAGDSLCTVVLVKASLDVPAPADGLVDKILIGSGETFARGQALALLRPQG